MIAATDPLIVALDVSAEIDGFGQLTPVGVDAITQAGYRLDSAGVLILNLGKAAHIADADLIRMALSFVHLDLILFHGQPAGDLVNRIRTFTTEVARIVLGVDQ